MTATNGNRPTRDMSELLETEARLTAEMTGVREDLRRALAAAHEVGTLEARIEAYRASSAYRSEDLRALENGLARARSQRGERERLRIEEGRLLRALEAVRHRLAGKGHAKVSLPLLHNLEVAAPCPAAWEDMQGDTDVRYCTQCEKDVFNLSMMTREEAEATLAASKAASMCIRFYRRADGTVLTQNCPVGVRNQHFWRRTKGIAAAGLLALALGYGYTQYVSTRCARTSGYEGTTGLEPHGNR